MDVAPVGVSADHHLIARQIFRRKSFGQFQSQFRSDLTRLKGLDDMVALPAACLAQLPLGVHHLLVLMAGVTILMGGEDAALRFLPVQYILDCLVQVGVPGQDLSDGHYPFATSCIRS